MLRQFTVRNFRCLRELDIEPLARVNLIVGREQRRQDSACWRRYIYISNLTPRKPPGM